MSIRVGNKIIANYTEPLPSATTTVEGKIRLATDTEITEGTSKTTAVTPYQLATSSVKLDNTSIEWDSDNKLSTIGVKSKTGSVIYDWVGTEAEYTSAVETGVIDDNWLCYVTDDEIEDRQYEVLTEIEQAVNNYTAISGHNLLEIYLDPLVDETMNMSRIANGQLIMQSEFPAAVNKLKTRIGWDSTTETASIMPNMICTEEEWQTLKSNSTLGQVSKFVIDDLDGTLRLPAIKNIQGVFDLQSAGGLTEAGLPNIQINALGSFARGSYIDDSDNGAIYMTDITDSINSTGTGSGACAGMDYSKKNSIYGNSDTVQEEACQYPWVICLNTGVQENEKPINEYEIASPYQYGMTIQSEQLLNTMGWLRSNGQENDGTVYVGLYNWILENYNAGNEGFKAFTDTFTQYDYLIDTENTKFILPVLIKSSRKLVESYTSGTDYYFIYSDGWCEQGGVILTSSDSYSTGTVTLHTPFNNDTYNLTLTSTRGSASANIYAPAIHTKSSDAFSYGNLVANAPGATWKAEGFVDIVAAEVSSYLYFFADNIAQSTQLVNAGRIQEQLVDKLDRGNKQEIMRWQIPDYSAVIDLGAVTAKVAIEMPADGILAFNLDSSGTSSYVFYINGVQIYQWGNVSGSMTIPVKKGDEFMSTGAFTTGYQFLYPFKGVL